MKEKMWIYLEDATRAPLSFNVSATEPAVDFDTPGRWVAFVPEVEHATSTPNPRFEKMRLALEHIRSENWKDRPCCKAAWGFGTLQDHYVKIAIEATK